MIENVPQNDCHFSHVWSCALKFYEINNILTCKSQKLCEGYHVYLHSKKLLPIESSHGTIASRKKVEI